MALQDTQHWVITSATNTVLNKYEAIRNHFNAAPGRWELGYLSSATDGIVVVRKAGGPVDVAVAIRRNGAADSLFVQANDAGYFDTGNTTNPAGSLGVGVAERPYVPGTTHTKMLIIEHDDAITILDYAAAETSTPVGVHAGRVYVPVDPAFAAAGMNGIGVLVGAPLTTTLGSAAANWVGGSATTQSRVRGFTTELNCFALITDAAGVVADQTPGAIAAPITGGVHVANTAGTSPAPGLINYKWLRFVSATATLAANPLTRYESADIGWCRIGPTASAASLLCINCEHNKPVK